MQMRVVIASAIVLFGIPYAAHAVPTVPEGYVLTQVATGLNGIASIYRDPSGRLLVTEVGVFGGTPGPLDGTVSELGDDGSLTVISSGYYDPVSVVVDSTGAIIVADWGPTNTGNDLDGRILKDNGTGPVILAIGPFSSPSSIIFDPSSPTMLLVSEDGYSLPCPGDAAVFSVDAMTGAISVFFDDGCGGLKNIKSIAADNVGNIYAGDNEPPNVYRLDSQTSAIPVVTAPPFVTPIHIQFNPQGDLFVAGAESGTIYIVHAGTDEALPFITGLSPFPRLFVDGDAIYFTSEGGQTIWVAMPLSPIPTVSEWGLMGMTLLLLTAGTIVYTRRRPVAA